MSGLSAISWVFYAVAISCAIVAIGLVLSRTKQPKGGSLKLLANLGYGLLFLAAIVVANLIVNHYGPTVTPYVAFGLDRTG